MAFNSFCSRCYLLAVEEEEPLLLREDGVVGLAHGAQHVLVCGKRI